jgi:hypothetical protein
MVLNIKTTVFWDMLSRSLVDREHGVSHTPKNNHFGTNSCENKNQWNRIYHSFLAEPIEEADFSATVISLIYYDHMCLQPLGLDHVEC